MKQYTRLLMALLLAALMSLAALSALASAVDDDTIPQERVTAVLSRDEEDGSIAVNGEVLGADQVALVSADGQTVVRDMSEPELQAIAGARWELQGVAGARGDDWNETYADNGGTNPGTPQVDFLGSADDQAVVRDMMDAERSAIAVACVDERNEYNAYNGGNDSEAPMFSDILDSSDDAGTVAHNAGGGAFAILNSSGDLSLQGGVKLDGLEITNNASDSTVTLESGAQAGDVAINGDNVTFNVQEGAQAGDVAVNGDNVTVNVQENAQVDNVVVNGSGTSMHVNGEVSNVYTPDAQAVAIDGKGTVGSVRTPQGVPLPNPLAWKWKNADAASVHHHSYSKKISYRWGNSYKTCTAGYRCAGCGQYKKVEKVEAVVETTPSTCTEDGQTVCTATFTAPGLETQTYVKVLKAKGHRLNGITTSVDDYFAPEDETVEATCAGTCKTCGQVVSETVEAKVTGSKIYPSKHKAQIKFKAAFHAPFGNGKMKGYTIKIKVKKGQHFSVTDPAVAATCTEAGLTEGSHCGFCGEVLAAQETVPALGHDWGEWTPDAEKSAETRACARCGVIETQPLVTPHVHTPAEAVRENEVAATCTAKGSYDRVVYCAVCKAELSRETVETEALSHTPAEAVRENEVAATCTAKGSYDNVVYCAVCKAELSRETVETKALGHTPAEAVRENEAPATCTAKGSYDRVVYCAVCKAELSRETVETEALSHTPAEAVRENEAPATCAAKGSYDSVVYCAVCKAELSRETMETPALSHTPAEAVRENEVAATCTAKGRYDNVVYCAVCQAELSRETVETKALGHTGGTATCLAKAVCKRCGEAYGEFGAHNYVSNGKYWEDEETHTWGHYEACSVCEDVKKVEDGRQEIQEGIEPIG